MSDKIRIALDIEVDIDSEEVVTEMLGQFADNARARLSEFYIDADILLTSNDGLYEAH